MKIKSLRTIVGAVTIAFGLGLIPVGVLNAQPAAPRSDADCPNGSYLPPSNGGPIPLPARCGPPADASRCGPGTVFIPGGRNSIGANIPAQCSTAPLTPGPPGSIPGVTPVTPTPPPNVIGTPTAPGENGNPRCAVVNYGPLPCPTTGSGIDPNTNGCYVRDPNDPTVANRSKFMPVPCDPPHPAFTPPAAIDCSDATAPSEYCDPAFACTGDQCNLTVKYINPIIKALAALVGVGVTIAIIVAGIQYSSSANDPQKVAAAKRRIINAILTLLGFFLFYRFLDWILPGTL